jgi:hypothetical protein
MNTISKWLAALALLGGPVVANSASVTYSFTGLVVSYGANTHGGTGIYSSIADGTPVTGTYTFNYDAAIQSTGTVGSASGWSLSAVGGTGDSGLPVPSGFVFSSTAQVGGLTYSTSPPAAYSTESFAYGSSAGTFNAQEQVWSATGTGSVSNVFIRGSNGASPFSSSGLPTIAGLQNEEAIGFFYIDNSGVFSEVDYDLTSLNGVEVFPVPIVPIVPIPSVPDPASAWLMLSGLVGVGLVAHRRRVESVAG